MSRRPHRFTPALVWAAVVGVASVTQVPALGPAPTGPGVPVDLLFHFASYAVLAALLVRAGEPALVAVALATAFGLGIETIQFFIPYRTAALLDAATNLVGALTGTVVGYSQTLVRGPRRWTRDET